MRKRIVRPREKVLSAFGTRGRKNKRLELFQKQLLGRVGKKTAGQPEKRQKKEGKKRISIKGKNKYSAKLIPIETRKGDHWGRGGTHTYI